MMTKTLPKGRRLYQIWKGNNKFYCGGRLIFGPDASSVLLTAVLIGGPALAFWSLSIANVNKSDTVLGPPVLSVAIIVTILDLLFLFLTSGRDPGIIPRKLHPREDPTEFGTYSMEWINGKAPHLRLPRMKDVLVNGVIVKVKYCDTCYLYRPARASHCSICNNCVQRFDHHCPWVGQCIGERNYRFFILFISFATFLCIYVFTFSLLNIIRKNKHGISIWDTMSKEILSVVLIIYCFIAVWFVGGLTIFHFFLISTNQTTYENFRYRYDKKENPYNKGIVRNFNDLFFSKMPASLNDFRSWIQDDFDESDTQSVGACIGSIDKGDLEVGREHEGGDMRVPSILQSLDYNGIDDKLRRNGKEYNSFDPFFSVDQESRDSIHSYTTIGTIVSEMTVEQNGLHGMTMFIDHDGRNIQL